MTNADKIGQMTDEELLEWLLRAHALRPLAGMACGRGGRGGLFGRGGRKQKQGDGR